MRILLALALSTLGLSGVAAVPSSAVAGQAASTSKAVVRDQVKVTARAVKIGKPVRARPTPKPKSTPTSSPAPTASPIPTASPTPTASPAPTGAPTSPTGLVPAVTKDCSVDVTAALNAWLVTVPDGATVDLAGGCYRAEGTVLLDRRNGITIDGNGATIRATVDAPDYANRAQLAVNLGSGITVRDMTLEGTNHTADCALPGGVGCYRATQEWDHNLRITGTDGVLVEGVRFRHAWGDAVALSPGGSWDARGVGAVMARNVTVRNSSVDTTGRMAFGCTGCKNFTVADNTITNVGYHVVDVEVEADVWSGDVRLLRNTYSNVYLSLLSAITGGGSNLGPFEVRGNVMLDNPVTCQSPIAIGQPGLPYGAVTIADNDLRSMNNGFYVNADSVSITSNRVTTGSGGCGDFVTPGSGTTGAVVTARSGTVTNNLFSGARPVVSANAAVIVCGNSNGGEFVLPQVCG